MGAVRVWGDPWLPDLDQPYVSTPELPYLGNPLVNTLFYVNENHWDRELIMDVFNIRVSKLILSIPTPTDPVVDSWYWAGEGYGFYSDRSAYKMSSTRS